jgi:hypothetical protein
MEFVGWIPNIAGRLSFSSLSKSYLTTKSLNVFLLPATPGSRFVAAYHRRVSNDDAAKAIPRALLRALIGKPAYRLDWPLRDTFDHFIVLRGSPDDETLAGRAYILRRAATADRWLTEFGKFYADFRLAGLRRDGVLLPVFEKFHAELDDIAGAENPANFMSADINIERSGECHILVPDAGPPTWPVAPFERALPFFRFARDLFHQHYHHPHSDDAFTGIREATAGDAWKVDTDGTLYRAVLGARRRGKPADLAEAAGRLAYLDAFQRKMLPPTTRTLEQLSQSLEASNQQAEHKAAVARLSFTVLLVAPFVIIEALAHLSAAVRDDLRLGVGQVDQLHAAMLSIYSFVALSPGYAIVLLSLFGAWYIHQTELLRPHTWPLIIDVNRALTGAIRRGRRWPVRLYNLLIGIALGFAISMFLRAPSTLWHVFFR